MASLYCTMILLGDVCVIEPPSGGVTALIMGGLADSSSRASNASRRSGRRTAGFARRREVTRPDHLSRSAEKSAGRDIAEDLWWDEQAGGNEARRRG